MKNTPLLLVLIVLFPFLITAQDYQPMLNDGSFWDVRSKHHDGEGCYYAPRRFYLDEEIMFNGKNYHKLRKHKIVDSEGEVFSCLPPNIYAFVEQTFTYTDVYIREDITEKKVYVWAIDPINGGDYQEFILYDFTLEVGDVLPTNTYLATNGESDMMVTDIQYNASDRKIIYLEDEHGYYSYIEGKGGFSGIISPILSIFEAPDEMYCFGDANNQNECSGFLGTENYIQNKFTIYPNPVHETLYIEANKTCTLELFNILGKKVRSYKGRSNHKINMSDFTKGFYLLKVTDETDGFTKTVKIVVE